jgi:hypothetical protein
MMKIPARSAVVAVLSSLAVGCSAPSEEGGSDPSSASAVSELGSCAAAKTGDHYEFLDDVCHRKFAPGNQDRAWSCPNVASSAGAYRPSSAPITVDSNALRGIVPADMRMMVVLVRRVGGVPFYRYLSNGSHDVAVQPLSSTKFMAVANAATRIRASSNGKVSTHRSTGFRLAISSPSSRATRSNSSRRTGSRGTFMTSAGARAPMR